MDPMESRNPPITSVPLRIGIDARPLREPLRGDGWYVHEICRALDRLLPAGTFLLYSASPVKMPVFSERWVWRTAGGGCLRQSPLFWLKTLGSLLCRIDRPDVFWGANLFLPWLPPHTRTIVTVHDLAPLLYPRLDAWPYRLAVAAFLKQDLKRATHLVANSAGTARRLKAQMARPPEAIIRPALRSVFTPPGKTAIDGCLKRYGLDRPYLLCVASRDPRKNIPTLVAAFNRLSRQGQLPGCRLVLVGRGFAAISSGGPDVAGPPIVPLGYVPEADLPMLYAGARALVFPSLYEGYGMPIMEARACGTRVVAADTPELREAGDENVIYTRTEPPALARAIMTALGRPRPAPLRTAAATWADGAALLARLLAGGRRTSSRKPCFPKKSGAGDRGETP